jgi:DNA-binding MarR family transcriptional regulator
MSAGLPPSAIVVLQNLRHRGPMSPNDISTGTKLPRRTVSFALKMLLEFRLIKRIPNLMDMRRPLYVTNLEAARNLVKHHGVDSLIGIQLALTLR